MLNQQGAARAYHDDGLGSVRAITDSSGALVLTSQTDAFGVPTASQGTVAQPFGFTGEQQDGTGLVFLRARSYDLATGRFLQRDPLVGSVGLPLSLNRYAYALSNPVTLTDPTGKCTAQVLCNGAPSLGFAMGLTANVATGEVLADAAIGCFVSLWCGGAVILVGGAIYVHQHPEVLQDLIAAAKSAPPAQWGDRYPYDKLPTGGEFPYRPKRKGADRYTPAPGGGALDDHNRTWKWDPQEGHWDVQNKKQGFGD